MFRFVLCASVLSGRVVWTMDKEEFVVFFTDEHRLHSGKLCLIILTCIAEVGPAVSAGCELMSPDRVLLSAHPLLFRDWKVFCVVHHSALLLWRTLWTQLASIRWIPSEPRGA